MLLLRRESEIIFVCYRFRNPWCEGVVHLRHHPRPVIIKCLLGTARLPGVPWAVPTPWGTPWWANYTNVRFIWSQKSTTIFCKSGSTSFHPGQRKSMLFPGSLSRPFLLCSTCLTGATICSKKRKAREEPSKTKCGSDLPNKNHQPQKTNKNSFKKAWKNTAACQPVFRRKNYNVAKKSQKIICACFTYCRPNINFIWFFGFPQVMKKS